MKLMLAIAGAGGVIAFGGLVYGILMVGVPYQDPTAAQAAAERADMAISDWAMGSGILMMLAAGSGLLIIGLGRLVWPHS